jgi:hypothetical protein
MSSQAKVTKISGFKDPYVTQWIVRIVMQIVLILSTGVALHTGWPPVFGKIQGGVIFAGALCALYMTLVYGAYKRYNQTFSPSAYQLKDALSPANLLGALLQQIPLNALPMALNEVAFRWSLPILLAKVLGIKSPQSLWVLGISGIAYVLWHYLWARHLMLMWPMKMEGGHIARWMPPRALVAWATTVSYLVTQALWPGMVISLVYHLALGTLERGYERRRNQRGKGVAPT